MAFVPLSELNRTRGTFVPLARNAPKQEEEHGFFGAPFTRGLLTVQSDFTAATGLLADAFGYDEAAQGFYNRADELAKESAAIPRRVGRVEDIKGPVDVGVFALETIIENAPLLASIAIPGLSAAKLAGLAGRGALTAAQLARKKKVVGTLAAFLSDVGLQTGESVQIAKEAGGDPLDLRVVGSGLGKGALDFVPILALAKKLGLTKGLPFGETLERHISGQLVERGFIRRAIGNVSTLIAYEVPTETAQEIINIALDRSISAFEGEITPEEKSQLLNAAGGAAAFGLLGIPASVVRPSAQPKPATEEELTAGDEAAIPLKLLTGPEQPKLLPAPALRITPEGVVLPQGVEGQSYSPELDTPRSGTSVAQGVAQALGREQASTEPISFVVTPDGITSPQIPDTHEQAASALRVVPELLRTPTEQQIIDIDDARAATVITTPQEIAVPEETQRVLPPMIATLVQARDDTFIAEGFRRSADGQLTKAGLKRIEQIDKRIAALSARLGVPNPLSQVLSQEITDAEKQLPAFNAEEDSKRSLRPDSRLTAQESALLDSLEETAIARNLTEEQDLLREELIAKREGAETKTSKKLTAEQVTQLETEQDRVTREREQELKSVGELTVEQVTQIVQALTSKFVRGPEYRIVDSKDKNVFPAGSQKKRDIQGQARGAFFLDEPTRVYIFADKHTDAADVTQTVLHETLAHHGLRAFFPEAELNKMLETLYRTRGREIQDRFGVPRDQSEALKFAEEFIAEVAENGIDQSTLQRVIGWIRRAFRKIAPNMKFTDGDIRFMLRDVSKFLSGQIPGRNLRPVTHNLSNEAFMRVAGRENVESVLPEIESLAKVWGTKFFAGVLTPLQLAEKFRIPGAKEYLEVVQLWAARKGTLTKLPADVANRWQRMPRKEAQIVSQALLEASEMSDGFSRALTEQEEIDLMKRLGAPKNVYDMFKEVRDSFKEVLNLLQTGLERAAIREAVKGFANPKQEAERILSLWERDRTKAGHKAFLDTVSRDPKLGHFKLGAKLLSIDNEMSILRDRNYFPRMRFGQYAIIVRAAQDIKYKGKNYKGPREGKAGKALLGEVVNYETFEDVPARNQRRASLGTQFKDQTKYVISEGYVADEEFSFLGMPPALFEALKTNLQLSPVQIETLKELYFRYSPGKAFLRHLTQRKGIDGYSTDAMRVYATYMMNAANHIARIEFSEDMGIQQAIMREAVRGASQEIRQATSAGIVQDYFNKHFRYIMNPENDLAALRSWGFLFYLGFNVKSAFVNLTQVPMVAYPFLAHHYGDAAATAAIARAYKNVAGWRRGKLIFDNETDVALRRAIDEGFVDESFATELAGIGESDVLQRLMPQDKNVRLTNEIAFYGSFLFKHAEKYNREVVFIAARELALKKNPHDQELAFKAGRKAVQATMFEYKKWNRPAFMRGKKSVLFLFWQYMQHLSFMAYGGEGKGPAARVWVMLLFAAGLQGLPFAENIFDLLDFGGTQAKELLGLKDPKVELRDDLRRFASTLTDRPDLIMHGWSRYLGLGPVQLLSLLGVPVPNTDISGSLSAGRVIPGTDALLGAERDPTAKFGRTMVEVLGPVIGVGYNIWKAMESDDPDTWKVWERALPTAMQGVSKSIRRSNVDLGPIEGRGEETFRGAGAVAKFDPFDLEERLENVAQFFSFATTRVNQRFELRHSQEELKRYWVGRQSAVKENYAWAILTEDKEVIELALKKLRQFNKEAPAVGLRVNAKKLKQSIREQFRRGHLREIGVPNEKAFREPFRKLAEAFPEGAPEG